VTIEIYLFSLLLRLREKETSKEHENPSNFPLLICFLTVKVSFYSKVEKGKLLVFLVNICDSI
jgi:hypothetical protein